MVALTISISAFYKWKERFLEYGDQWVRGEPITKAICLPFSTAKTTRKEIVELSLSHPSWGAERLSKQIQLDRGCRISRSTIYNILAEKKLATRRERAKALYEKHLTGVELTPLQRDVVRCLVEPVAFWKGSIGKRAGCSLTQGIIRTHRTSPLGITRLHVVVDTYDKRAFAMFPTGNAQHDALECLLEAIKAFGASPATISEIFTDAGYDFEKLSGRPYADFLRESRISHRWHGTTANRQNPMAKSVWKRLKPFLFEDNYARCLHHKDSPEGLNSIIKEFLLPEAM